MGLLDDAIRDHLDLKRRRGADPADIERAEREALGPVRREPAAASFEEAGVGASTEFASEMHGVLEDHDGWATSADSDLDDDLLATEAEPVEAHAEPDDATMILEPEVLEPVAEPSGTEPAVPAEPAAPTGGPSGIAAPDYSEPEFDDHHARHRRLGGLFHRRNAEPDPQPEPPREAPSSPRAVRRIDRSEPIGGQPPAETEPFVEDDAAFDKPDPVSSTPSEPPSLQIGGDVSQGHTVEYDVEKAFRDEDAEETDEDILEETPDFLADTPDHDRLWFEQKPPPDFDFDA